MVFGCPITSSSVCPNIRWAAEFQLEITPARFVEMIASFDDLHNVLLDPADNRLPEIPG